MDNTVYLNKGLEYSDTELKTSVGKILPGDKVRYYIKRSDGVFANPYDVDFPRKNFKWMKVSAECFDFYTRFIRSRNTKLLLKAERCI